MNFEESVDKLFIPREYGDTLNPSQLDEIKVWSDVLGVLINGMPVAFSPIRHIEKIEKEEDKSGKDYSFLKTCCQNIAEIREVKNFRPIIFEIINRIAEVGELENRIKYYE